MASSVHNSPSPSLFLPFVFTQFLQPDLGLCRCFTCTLIWPLTSSGFRPIRHTCAPAWTNHSETGKDLGHFQLRGREAECGYERNYSWSHKCMILQVLWLQSPLENSWYKTYYDNDQCQIASWLLTPYSSLRLFGDLRSAHRIYLGLHYSWLALTPQ